MVNELGLLSLKESQTRGSARAPPMLVLCERRITGGEGEVEGSQKNCCWDEEMTAGNDD